MRKINSIIALIAVSIAVSSITSAQETATAATSSTVITPISIEKNIEMNFGNVAVSSASGKVVLVPEEIHNKTGLVTLPKTTVTITAAKFTINGEGGYAYSITLPATNLILTDETSTETIAVSTFKSTPNKTGTLTAGGSQNVFVGATLNVKGSQAPGTYKNDNGFNVTVNYN